MRFSLRQILASTGGAVLAALIASSFGVTGTIIGVAIGSAAATIGTALVSQSIERGHQAVKQVAVRVPDGSTTTLLRRLGRTGAVGEASSSPSSGSVERPVDPSAPTEVVRTAGAGAVEETREMESAAASVEETQRLEITAVADAPPTEHLIATTAAVPPLPPEWVSGSGVGAGGRPRTFTWPVIVGTAAAVFVLALLLVTAIELIAGKPLSSIYGHTGSGPSVSKIFNQSPPATSTTTPTSTSPSTTTSTSTSTTTTSTTTPSTTGLSNTTTTVGSGATTTTGAASTSGTSTTATP